MFETLLHIGSFNLQTFDVLLAVGFLAGTAFLVRFLRFKKRGIRFLVHRLFWFVPLALVGGRLGHVIDHFAYYRETPLSLLEVWDRGFSGFGVFYVVLALLAYLSWRDREDFWAWLDAFAMASLVGLFFIHLGHFFEGSDYGKPTGLPWGIVFRNPEIPFASPLHPTQLYSALATLLILGGARWSARRTHLPGVVGTLAIMLYSVCAFGIDFLHAETSLSVKVNHGVVAAAAFISYIYCSHRKWLSEQHNSEPNAKL